MAGSAATRMRMSDPLLSDSLLAGMTALGLAPDESVSAQLLEYVGLLQRWNGAYNLTAVREPAQMVTRHLLDSLAVAPYVQGEQVADLGSGAGLPGLPLAILMPQRQWLLVDANGKKARFLREAVRSLGLAHVRVAQQRVEDVTGSFDCITARAFASLGDMLAWGGHLLAPDGVWLAMKGRRPDDELAALPAGFRVESMAALDVPGLQAERHLVVIRRATA